MSVKAAGYVAGYVVARTCGNGWTDDVRSVETYSGAEDLRDYLGKDYEIYALVLDDMSPYFDAMVYGG